MNEIEYVNKTYHSRQPETNTRKCVINRNSRIKAINLTVFGDKINQGFANWERFDYTTTPPRGTLCICGQELESIAHYIWRKDPTKHDYSCVCLGDKCIEQLDKEHGTDIISKYKSLYKKCVECGAKSTHKNEKCKKCDFIKKGFIARANERIKNQKYIKQ
tara:strand:- start:163 stop:645 length:483 start_codon:yes stop_codon:yes gene_type:complete